MLFEHSTRLAADVRAHPERYGDPVQSLYSAANGEVDLQLLRHADAVVHELARIAVVGDDPID